MGEGWLSQPQLLYQHHHFWAWRMLYLSITIATPTTSPRTVGFILWRRKFGRELMPMKSPDYHMPHRQAHPGGCGSRPSPAGSVWCYVPAQHVMMSPGTQPQRRPSRLTPAHTQELCFPSCDLGQTSKKGMLPSGNPVTARHSSEGLQGFCLGYPSSTSPACPTRPNLRCSASTTRGTGSGLCW